MIRLIPLLLLTGCASVSQWPTQDRVLLALDAACHATDTAQTVYGLENGYREGNKMLTVFGESPAAVVGSKALIEGSLFYAATILPDHYRTALLIFDLVGCSMAVENNHRLGVRFGF